VVVIIVIAMISGIFAQQKLSTEQYRALVVSELQKQGNAGDSAGAALVVTGYGKGVDDFVLIPVFSQGRVKFVYRNDTERSSITQIASSLVLRSVRSELFSEHGAIEVLKGIKVSNPKPQLVSCGPFSLFGALGAGWYQKTGSSFVLLAFNGRIVNESEVAELWPEKVALLKSIAADENPGLEK
jgi:hypothetical protein